MLRAGCVIVIILLGLGGLVYAGEITQLPLGESLAPVDQEDEEKIEPPEPSASPHEHENTSLQDENRLSKKLRIHVKKFKITGNKIFSDKDLSIVTKPYEREITSEELESLREELTRYYVERGYITSGVIIPDQEVLDGIVHLEVIEGVLTRIDVEGNKHFRSSYIGKRLMLMSGPTVNVNNIQQSLQLLQQDPRIRRINAELGPGIKTGEAILKVRVEEECPYKAILTFSNTQSPSLGPYRGELLLAHTNLLGLGDILEGRFSLTSGSYESWLSYSMPVTARDTTLKAYYNRSAGMLVDRII
jgi:hemolysin activation/secretion protein